MNLTPECLQAYPVLDSNGSWTLGVELQINGTRTSAMVPAGASLGAKEAATVGIPQAIESVKEIAQALSGRNVRYQSDIDKAMKDLDGTLNKERLGSNAILGVSLAVAKAGAVLKGVELYEHIAELYGEAHPTLLPTPMMNVINGGVHANNGLPLQEFMIMPTGARTFYEALDMGASVYKSLGKVVSNVGVGAEGGYAPPFKGYRNGVAVTKAALNILTEGTERAGFSTGKDVLFAIDAASSQFYKDGRYTVGSITFTNPYLFFSSFIGNYPIISLEDGASEDDFTGWQQLTKRLGKNLQLVGDDVFVTNPLIFAKGIEMGIGNAILIKLNQIGTLTETLEVAKVARAANINVVVSNRSGETEDTTIADLVVGIRGGQIKTGAPARGERTAKYNRLLAIERRLGNRAEYAGYEPFRRFDAVA